jgi:uncharacterized phiE125 gp8 family phage protein
MRYALRLITAPTGEPVELAEATAHLRIDDDVEDDYVRGILAAARGWCEKYQNRAYLTQSWRLTLDAFPRCSTGIIRPPRAPLRSVTNIQYVDEDGDTQTWASSNYLVDAQSEPGRIALAYGASWPTTRCQIGAVTVNYSAGYGEATDVPEETKHAIKLLVGHWFANREGVFTGSISKEIEFAVKALLSHGRVFQGEVVE